MKNYILVHGAFGGAWEFEDVKKLLEADGNKVTAVDLPGHGENKKAIPEVTMAAYVNEVIDTINYQNEQVILVGHSLAGVITAQVAEAIPEKIERLIFVAAILPANGQTAMGLMSSDPAGKLLPNITFSEDQTAAYVTEEVVRNILLNDIKDEALLDRFAPHFVINQATEPFMAEAKLSNERFGPVAKSYVRAGIDKVLTPNLQDKMIENWEMNEVFTLKSGHFPLNSMPEKLVEAIRKASNSNLKTGDKSGKVKNTSFA